MVSLRQLDVCEEREEEMRVGRIAERLAKPQLGVGERGMVLLHRGTDRLVIGPGRLNGDDTGPVAPAYAPRGLRHELERPLGRAEVWKREERVRVQHGQRRRVREVVPLRDHLRAEERLGAPGLEVQQDARGASAPGGRVAVENGVRNPWEALLEAFGQALGPET